MRFRIPELFLGAFLAVAIFATGMLFATSYYSSPTTNNQSKQTESTAQDGHAGIPITENAADSQTAQHKEEKSEFWSAKLTDWLLASFTLFLVAFTGALVRSTNRLWQAAIDQGRLTENAFAQLEGPLIDISKITAEIEVASPHYSAENGPRVSVHFKNHGRGPASITMLNCRFAFIEKLPDIPPYLKGTARATTLSRSRKSAQGDKWNFCLKAA
jgi:hypothetical protein